MNGTIRWYGVAATVLLLAGTLPAYAEEYTAGTGTAPTILSRATTTMPASPALIGSPTVTGPIPAGSRLTLDQCVEIALRRNPALATAEATLNAVAARVGEAKSAYYPQVSLSGSYNKYSLYSDPTNETQTQYTGNALVTQNLFDFGKTPSQVRIQRLNETAAGYDRRSTVSQVVFGVQQAYYALLQAMKNREVAAETVKLNQDQLDQAQGFYDAGVKSKYDVTSAEVNMGNAKLGLIKAENAVRIAQVTLNNAMGVPDAPEFSIEDALTFRKSTITFPEAADRAFANRPELGAQRARRESSREAVSLARTGYYPNLTGNASYTRAGETAPPDQSGWSAGVTLTVPLFNGFLTNNQVREAKQNLNAAEANEELLRQSILLDVQQAYLALHQAEDSVDVAELTVRQAQENYDIANGRYGAGVGSPLDVSNALVVLANAKTNYISALATCKIAEAALVKAMGGS